MIRHLMQTLVLAALGLAACSTTTVLTTWKKPGVTELDFDKVVVVVPVEDQALRRRAEDELVDVLAPRPAVASHRLMPEPGDAGALRQRATELGFDGALVLRVTEVERESTWVPSSYTMGPYHGMGSRAWAPAGRLRVDTFVRVESSFLALPEQDLHWAATSSTANPKSLEALIGEVIRALRKELKNEGLTPSPVS